MDELEKSIDELNITKREIAKKAGVSLRMVYLWLQEKEPGDRLLEAVKSLAVDRALAAQECHAMASRMVAERSRRKRLQMEQALEAAGS